MTEHRAIDPGEHRVFADPSRIAVLETVRGAEHPLDARKIAAAVGLHPNTVRNHLALLIERGFVTSRTEERDRPGRPRMLYSAREGAGMRDYRLLAETLVAHVAGTDEDRATTAIAAGRAQGVRIAGAQERPATVTEALERVTEVLGEANFRPRVSTDRSRIDLRHCPFRELAEASPEIVCGVHLGVIRGILHGLRAPVDAARLRPFIEPGRCTAELRPARRRAKVSPSPGT